MGALLWLAGATPWLAAQEHAAEEQAPARPPLEETLAICATCHGEDGNTPTVAEYPKLGGQYASYLAHAMKSYRAGRRDNPLMFPYVMDLTDREINAIAEYYARQDGLKQISQKQKKD